MRTPPTPKIRRWLRSALLPSALAAGMLLAASPAASAAGTPDPQITIADTFLPSDRASTSAPLTYRIEISSSLTNALTNVSVPFSLSGASSIDSASSTCGGSLSLSGTSGTWSGMNIAASGGATNPTICRIEVQMKASATPGSYTTSLPAGSITTDQGLSNGNSSAKTLVVTQLQPLTPTSIWGSGPMAANGVSDPYNWSYGSVMFNDLNYARVRIQNSNDSAITGINITQDVPFNNFVLNLYPDPTRPAECSSAADQASAQAAQASATWTAAGKLLISGLDVSAKQNCIMYFRVEYKGDVDGYVYPDNNDANYPGNVGGQTNAITLVTGNAVSPSANGQGSFQANSTPGMAMSKSFNGVYIYNTRSDTNPIIDLAFTVRNSTKYDATYSFQDVLPAGLTLASSSVTAERVSGNGPCTADGMTADVASGTITAVNLSIPRITYCRYHVQVNKPASVTGTITNQVLSRTISQSNAIYTVPVNPTISSGIRGAEAKVINQELLSGSKPNRFATAWTNDGYTINLANSSSSAAITGLTFTDRWTHGLAISSSIPTTQCGGTLVIDADRKGFSFSGGSIAAGGSCGISIPIDPNSADPGSYQNTTSAITHDTGGIGALAGTLTYTAQIGVRASGLAYPIKPDQLVQGIPGSVTFYLGISSAVTGDYVFTTQVPAGLSLDLSRGILRTCTNSSGATDGVLVDPSQYSYDGTTFILREHVDAGGNKNGCRYSMVGTASGSGPYQSTPTVTFRGTPLSLINSYYYGYNALMINASVVAPIAYTANKSFSAQTLQPGQTANMQISVKQASGGTTVGGQRDYSDSYAQITDHLPNGLVVPTNWNPGNQPDGHYVSSQVVPNLAGTQGYPESAGVPTAGMPCLEISSDRSVLIIRCINNYPNIPVMVMKYGDLTNTIQPSEIQTFYGTVQAAASATITATRGIIINKSFDKATIKSGSTFTMTIKVTNVAVPGDGENVITVNDSLWPQLSVASLPPTLGGDCAGAAASYTPSPNFYTNGSLSVSGIRLMPDTSCTFTLVMKGINSNSTPQTVYNFINPGSSTSSNGASNAAGASAQIIITPSTAPQGSLVKYQSRCSTSACSDVSWTTQAVSPPPCGYISYLIVGSLGSGGGSLFKPAINDRWPAELRFTSASGSFSGARSLWQVDGGTISGSAPAADEVTGGQTIRLLADSDNDGQSTGADQMAPSSSVSMQLVGQVLGPACMP